MAALPVGDFEEAKATAGGIDMASSGNGTLQHLLLELFRLRTGITINQGAAVYRREEPQKQYPG